MYQIIVSIFRALKNFSEQEDRIVDLSKRSSFAGFGAPGSEDEYVFYVGSLVYVYDLVKKYGDGFISDVVANNCTSINCYSTRKKFRV